MTNEELTEFSAHIRDADLGIDAVFAEVVRGIVEKLGLSVDQVSEALGVSRPTVNRWMNEVTSPQLLMREPVRQFALRCIASRSN